MEKQSGEERHEGLRQAVKAFSVLGGIGIYLVVFVGICVFLGNLADENFGLGYMGKLAGILIGFPGALYTLYRQLKQGNLL
ncbi:AtpZ/AtpI family protein [Selenomonas sp. ND2010]|uniref:AtpZ/AtpI family protein n=1 Tax=Selenomonas sp. ND2010 TaxID=1410618 RepID=UPI00051B1FA8|nr:AtpZ/AtpI family protein [Selenomonas sp. ND2010]